MGFLDNKKILITGLLSNRSIAYGIARAMHREGAQLAFSFQGERVKDRVAELAAEFGSRLVLPAMSQVTPRSTPCSPNWPGTGTASTASFTRSRTRRAKRWPAITGFGHPRGIPHRPRH